jgi:hypothetical protein
VEERSFGTPNDLRDIYISVGIPTDLSLLILSEEKEEKVRESS